jgi:hypothetical protein
MKDVQLMFR